MSLGNKVKKYRLAKGWTLDQLSEASGVKLGTLGALEARNSKRSADILEIAQALGLTVEQLMSDEDHQPAQPTGEVFQVMTAEESELLYNFRSLTDEDRALHYEEIAAKAAKTRAHVEKVLKTYGYKPPETNGHTPH